ncbi:hypothetical protein OPKNFCMD_1804 [Methylobacterium crusticola]|uniref:Uncharacterized protein n=2 Tax=Methylobacterium crusticola TaxID=1697972 RepID=A0ABQ4QWG5_9HYPH|nr:hypothetical protein [Methylobacterium crusticola]GJD49075.1 hypothetical protein OPKNFCMD_1804 [Methylobacterium crusticola]
MALFRAACSETDRLSHDAVHGYPELNLPTFGSWTRRCLNRALDTGEVTPTEYARLYPLAAEREHRINAATLSTNIHALYALAFADDYPCVEASSLDDDGDDYTHDEEVLS